MFAECFTHTLHTDDVYCDLYVCILYTCTCFVNKYITSKVSANESVNMCTVMLMIDATLYIDKKINCERQFVLPYISYANKIQVQ